MKKRIVSLLLALVMMTSLLPTQVFAVDTDDAAAEQPVVEQQQEEKQEPPVDPPQQEPPVVEQAEEEPQQEPTAVYAADGDTAAYTLTVTADTDTGKEAIGKTEFYVNGFDTAKGQLPLDTPLNVTKNTTGKMQFRVNKVTELDDLLGVEVSIDGNTVRRMFDDDSGIPTKEEKLADSGVFSNITIKQAANASTPHKIYLYFNNTNSAMTDMMVSKNITIMFIFDSGEQPNYSLTATPADDNGKVLETKWLKNLDNGDSLYGLWVRPDYDYRVSSYTSKDTEHKLTIPETNYYVWKDPDTGTSLRCEYFELAISEDTDITLNFAPATMELVLHSYKPATSPIPFWAFGNRDPNNQTDVNNELLKEPTIPLVEDSGAYFVFRIDIDGFVKRSGDDPSFVLEIYQGDTTAEDALLFTSEDPSAFLNGCSFGGAADGGLDTTEYFFGGHPGIGYAGIVKCPDMKQITAVVRFDGKELKTTADVQMTSDVSEVKEFLQYYKDTYGLDKMGQEAYTEEEKQTDAYKLYCQYSTFRYEMRKVYREQAQLIAASTDRAAALDTAKAALNAAARGEGCNAVSWSFLDSSDNGTHNKPILTAIPNDGDNINKTGTSASDAMCAALEAEYPGNWSYNCTATQFGMFVNSVTVGGENDRGTMNVRRSSSGPGSSYGFWYYNGKFSEWGVSNYYPYDGDIMSWGNPDVARSWALAILRFHYKNNGGDDALEKDMADRGVSFTSSGEALEKAFPEYDFSRYGQFREVTEAERVIQLINAIGTVSPDSGDDIAAARKAYDALSEAEQEKVYNYSVLTDAEAAFAKLSQSADVKYEDALANTLAKLNQTKNVGIGSTNGEWLVLALARGGVISGTDTSGIGASYLNTLFTALRDSQGTKLTLSTDYARVTLAMSALGVEAPDSVLDMVRDYDRVTAQGINAVVYALLALDSKPYDKGDDALRDKYVAFLLDNACENGGWVYGGDKNSTADVDMTAMAIQALAPYYLSGDANVKTAVDKGLSALKTMQQSTGGFASYGTYNAESTAQVIVALTALGIDPTSAEWKKTGDPVDALLHFYDASASMFRHTTNGTDDQMATEQAAYALVAYNRFAAKQNRLYDMSDAFSESGEVKDPKQTIASAKLEIGSMGRQTVSMTVANTEDEVKSYIDTRLKLLTTKGPTYEVSVRKFVPAVAGTETDPNGTGGSFIATVTITMDSAKDTADIYGTITATKYEAPKEDITVTFQLLGDDHHTIKTDADVHTYRFNADEMPVWIDTVTVTVPGGSTVGDVFKQVLDEKGYTYVGLEQGYISSITTPDNVKLSHKDDKRDNSGWMYVVNGKHPNVGLNAYELQKGDVITWHWCDDYTIEEGSEKWSGSRVIEYIENLIKLIGEVDASDACKARIDKARAAYDKLTNTEKENVGNYQTLQDAEAKYKSLTGMDALVSLIEEQTWTVSMNDANDAAAVKTWLEAKLNALDLNGAKATATVTDLTAATAGTAENKNGTDGSFTFDVTLTLGEGNAQVTRVLTGLTGTITATAYVKSTNAGVSGLVVAGETATISGNSFTVTVPYGTKITAESFKITLADSKASITTLPHEENGVWSFTVTAEDGTAVTYTVTVTVGKSPEQTKVDTVIDLINGIGKVDKNSKDKIDAARKAYDGLTEDQKKLVPDSVLKTLTDAEAAYAKLTKPGNKPGNKPTTGSDTKKDDGKTVKSGKTGDAGIVLYVGMGLLSLTGGALVLGKKKKQD